MNREDWDRRLAEAVRRYNEPPPTPRERIWTRIAAARAEQRSGNGARPERTDGNPHGTSLNRRWWRRRAWLWPAVTAAALVAGLVLGRWTFRDGTDVIAPAVRTETATALAGAGGESEAAAGRREADARDFAVFRRAAQPLLDRSEMLLVQVATADSAAETPPSFSERAAGLLAETRLLLDSPASRDPELNALLEDLELALARVVQIAAGSQVVERSVLAEGLKRHAVLARLRARLDAADPRDRL